MRTIVDMEMSAAEGLPAGTTRPTRPTRTTRRPSWRNAAVIVATSSVLALPGYALWRSVTTCGGGLECMLNGPIAGAFSVVVMPVTAGVLWLLCRIPRPFLLALVTVAIGHVLALSVANGFGDGFGDSLADVGGPISGTAPAPVYVLIGVVSGLAGIVLVWQGIWSRQHRVGVVALVALLSFAGNAFGERVSRQQHEDRLSAVGVPTYLPDFSDLATPSVASAWGTEFSETAHHIEISYDSANSADLEGPRLILLATTDGGCGDAVRAGYMEGGAGPPDSTCRKTADGFVADDPTGAHYVGVSRGDTILVLRFPRSSFDDTKIADSLRRAPQVSVADLARL